MKIINLWAGPGVGKSTAAAGLFYEMKKLYLNAELVTEYAKEVTWEKRFNLLDDQIYIFAKQHRRISRLDDHGIDWVVTDSPIPLGLVYLKPNVLSNHFNKSVMETFDKFENCNYLLLRKYQYNPVGRNQTAEEAIVYDQIVLNLLIEYGVKFKTIPNNEDAIDMILKDLGLR